MSISLRTQAVMMLVITALNIGCCSKNHNHKPKPKPPIGETEAQKQEREEQEREEQRKRLEEQRQSLDELQGKDGKDVKEIKKAIASDVPKQGGETDPGKTNPTNGTSTIDPKPVAESKYTIDRVPSAVRISYKTIKQPGDCYLWDITNTNGESVKFYGQASNEVTITDLPHADINKPYQINITCKVDSIAKPIESSFTIDPIDVERLEIQRTANEARASWLATVLGKSNKPLSVEDQLESGKADKAARTALLAAILGKSDEDVPMENKLANREVDRDARVAPLVEKMKADEEAAREARTSWLATVLSKLDKPTEDQLAKMKLSQAGEKEVLDKIHSQDIIFKLLREPIIGRKFIRNTTIKELEQLFIAEANRFFKDLEALPFHLADRINKRRVTKDLIQLIGFKSPDSMAMDIFEEFSLGLRKYVDLEHCINLDTNVLEQRFNEWRNEVNRYGILPTDYYYFAIMLLVRG